MLSRIRYLGIRLVPGKLQGFIGRHFTWLSGTLIGFSIAANLILVVLYVPGATANALLGLILSIGAGAVTLVSFVGGLLTIQNHLDKKQFAEGDSVPGELVDRGLSSPAQGFVRTEEELMGEAMRELEGWFEVHSDGQIKFVNEGVENGGDPKAMLFVFAARVAYEAGYRETPKVSKEEIKEVTGFSSRAASVFISKMDDFIGRNFDPDEPETYRDLDDSETKVELNRKKAREAVKYIIGERRAPN